MKLWKIINLNTWRRIKNSNKKNRYQIWKKKKTMEDEIVKKYNLKNDPKQNK
jgi:hypothetical protein